MSNPLGRAEETRFQAQARQANAGYPVALPDPKDTAPNSASDEREKARQALTYTRELQGTLGEAILALFQQLERNGYLSVPLDTLLHPPAPTGQGAATGKQEPPPASALAATYRQIRDHALDLNGALSDMVGAVGRVRSAIDE